MKPINLNKESCNPISSNCVIWQGPDIKCLKICKGDTVSDVVANLAGELCNLIDQFDITGYDLSCLEIQTCAPDSIRGLIQLLIQRICALEGVTPTDGNSTSGCPNCTVQMASCFHYTNPTNGDLVTTSLLADYVALIGIQICSIITQITALTEAIAALDERVTELEGNSNNTSRQAPSYITPICVSESIPTPISEVVQFLERAFCELRVATGTPDQLFSGVAAQCSGINSAPALGTSGGIMSSLPGWKSAPSNVADALNNIWLAICDLRSSTVNIKANCCDTSCNAVSVSLVATLPSPTNLVLFFTGSVPSNLTECSLAGTLVSISDQSGNSISTTIPLIANLNNISGYPINLGSTPLNTSDDLTISSTMCFKDDETGSVCQSILSYTFINTSSCPTVNYISTQEDIEFSFTHNSGPKTYVVELYSSTNVLLQSQTYSVTDPVTISGAFLALSANTIYKIRVKMVTTTKTTYCPFTVVTTLTSSCPPPQTIVAILSID
jgi:hypothetical protein